MIDVNLKSGNGIHGCKWRIPGDTRSPLPVISHSVCCFNCPFRQKSEHDITVFDD